MGWDKGVGWVGGTNSALSLEQMSFQASAKGHLELHSLRVCRGTFQSLEAEFEKALKTNCFFMTAFREHLERADYRRGQFCGTGSPGRTSCRFIRQRLRLAE